MYKFLGHSELKLYDLLNVVSFFALLIFNLTQLKQKKLNLSKISQYLQKHFLEKSRTKKQYRIFLSDTFWAVIETIIISCVQLLPITFLNFKFGKLVGTGANYFGLAFFIPYILLLFCFLIRVNPLKQIDLIVPAFPLALTIAKIACFCAGCCRGIESSFGLYNNSSGLIEFPVQLLESGLAFLIFIFLIFWRKKAKEGTMFPTYLIIYSATRFFSEFLRVEPNVLGGLKTYQILCIIGVTVGSVELFLILKFGDKITKFYNLKNKQ